MPGVCGARWGTDRTFHERGDRLASPVRKNLYAIHTRRFSRDVVAHVCMRVCTESPAERRKRTTARCVARLLGSYAFFWSAWESLGSGSDFEKIVMVTGGEVTSRARYNENYERKKIIIDY